MADNNENMFVNPYYAININQTLTEHHEPMVSKKDWIKVNSKLIDEFGKEKWLKQLLEVLEADRPKSIRDLA